jgi:C4-dicarboxylate-specific signal transduction histidine kinase
VGSAPEIKRPLDRLAASVDTAVRIVSGTLQSARRSAARPALVPMADVVRRVLDLKAYDFRRAGVRVTLQFPAAFPLVRAVPFQIQQVLLNLVTNAQQAMQDAPPPRVLAITGRVAGPDIVVVVADTGPGIAHDLLPRVFEPFVTTKKEGTGLGLAISAGIVRDLCGDLVAENRPEGGAVFRLRLPIAGPAGDAEPVAAVGIAGGP